MRENAHNFYNTFTRSLQNCYDFPRLRSVYSSACPDGDLMIGLARELLRAILASLFPHEDLSSCYYGNTQKTAKNACNPNQAFVVQFRTRPRGAPSWEGRVEQLVSGFPQ